MGDFNAVVGEGREDRVVGKFGLGKRNNRGERLIEFCKSQNLVITNTWFILLVLLLLLLGLQSLMDSLNTTAKHCVMKVNIKTTKAMVVSRNGGEREST